MTYGIPLKKQLRNTQPQPIVLLVIVGHSAYSLPVPTVRRYVLYRITRDIRYKSVNPQQIFRVRPTMFKMRRQGEMYRFCGRDRRHCRPPRYVTRRKKKNEFVDIVYMSWVCSGEFHKSRSVLWRRVGEKFIPVWSCGFLECGSSRRRKRAKMWPEYIVQKISHVFVYSVWN